MASSSTQTTDLLDLALAGHGGLERWHQIDSVAATLTLTGGLFALKGRADGLGGLVTATAATKTPQLTFRPFAETAQGSFEPDRVAVSSAVGEVDEREDPRAAFADHELNTPWDSLDLLYFAGYAMWNYLATPFMLARPGFEADEIDPWDEDGETWRRLRVEFPPDVPTHCPEQVFYFDERGLLRRLDYAPEIVNPAGPIPAAHYCHDYKEFDGLSVPTRRRVYGRREDGTPALDQLVVELDIDNVTLST